VPRWQQRSAAHPAPQHPLALLIRGHHFFAPLRLCAFAFLFASIGLLASDSTQRRRDAKSIISFWNRVQKITTARIEKRRSGAGSPVFGFCVSPDHALASCWQHRVCCPADTPSRSQPDGRFPCRIVRRRRALASPLVRRRCPPGLPRLFAAGSARQQVAHHKSSRRILPILAT